MRLWDRSDRRHETCRPPERFTQSGVRVDADARVSVDTPALTASTASLVIEAAPTPTPSNQWVPWS